MRRLILILFSVSIAFILGGCGSFNHTDKTEPDTGTQNRIAVTDITFKKNTKAVFNTKVYTITTDDKTIVLNFQNDPVYETTAKQSYMVDTTIYLTKEDIKKYSKTYADAFNETLPVSTSEKGKEEMWYE